MKVIIAGSRNYIDEQDFMERMNGLSMKHSFWLRHATEVVSGTARGPDQLGEKWAELMDVPVTQFPPNWDKYGRMAGHIRNGEMAQYADALIAFWDGISPGTRSMIDMAKGLGLKVHIEMI